MVKALIAVCTFVLCVSLTFLAQDTSSQAGGAYPQSSTASQGQTSGDQAASTGETSAPKAKLHHIKGTIGQDGKTFTADKDNKSWTIVNPDAVQGHEGHHVVLSAHVYPDKDQVHVMAVKMAGEGKGESKSKPMSEQQPQ